MADAKTLVEIVWLLPGKAAREFRRSSAETVCRVLGGDISLVKEIEARHHELNATPEGQETARFLTAGNGDAAAVAVVPAGLPLEIQIATAEQKKLFVDNFLQRQHMEHTMKILQSARDFMQQCGGLDERDKIEFKDRCRSLTSISTPSSSSTALVVVAEVAPVDPGVDVATPDCLPAVRGAETSMHMIASEMGVTIGTKAGQIGKSIKRKYQQRYGEDAAARIPKRSSYFRGKPFPENTYWSRDSDLIRDAITEVVGA